MQQLPIRVRASVVQDAIDAHPTPAAECAWAETRFAVASRPSRRAATRAPHRMAPGSFSTPQGMRHSALCADCPYRTPPTVTPEAMDALVEAHEAG